MTNAQLRTEADHLERLAKVATPGPWRALAVGHISTVLGGVTGELTVAWCGGCVIVGRHSESAASVEDGALITACDPAATLRRVAEMRLLADVMDALQQIAGGSDHAAILLARPLLARLGALETGDAK